MAKKRPSLAIVDLAMAGWTAGASYTEGLARSLVRAGAGERFELVALSSAQGGSPWTRELGIRVHVCSPDWRTHVHALLGPRLTALAPRAAGVASRLASAALVRTVGDVMAHEVERAGASVVLPVVWPMRGGSFRKIGWIADFQHVHEPSFFVEEERASRDATFRGVAAECDRVILSSAWAKQHFDEFVPEHAHKGFQASFPSLFAFRALPETTGTAARRYRLPQRFALVVNQMWKHKNHRLVVDAVAAARDRGVDVPVVMIGSPADYRDPANAGVSALLQRVAELGVHELIHVLGGVPRDDLVDLTRCAAVCIQPSRFEGWSTTVEDAKALGRPLLCSDLPVHHEQAPGALGFFGCDDAAALADLLVRHFPGFSAGPDRDAETQAVERERSVASAFGERLLAACAGLDVT